MGLSSGEKEGFLGESESIEPSQCKPATALETLPVRAEAKGTLTRTQLSKLVRAATGDWRSAILFAYFTGARLFDVAEMQWNPIDWKNKVIRFTPGKTKSR
jgi:integrase